MATAAEVKRLREETNAGVMDCKRALDENGGDIEKAKKWLHEKGIAGADKKAERETSQGLVDSYIHAGGRIGVMRRGELRDGLRRAHRRLQEPRARHRAPDRGHPDDHRDHRGRAAADAEGAVEETVLMKQHFIKDGSRTIEQLVKEVIAQTGENIRIRRFTRYELGQ